jgi:hypothetical protein
MGICKEVVLARTDFVPECEVEKNDFVMEGGVFSLELRLDVLSVFEEFFPSVRESE